MDQETKTCPHCGGQILAAATKCKHCRARLVQSQNTSTQASTSTASLSRPLPAAGEAMDVDVPGATLNRGRSDHTPRSTMVAVATCAIPLVLLVIHFVVFGTVGVLWLVGSLLVAILAACFIVSKPAQYGCNPAETLRRARVCTRAAAGTVVVAIIGAEVMALHAGIPARNLRQDALAALTDTDPCAFEKFGRIAYHGFGLDSEYEQGLARCDKTRQATAAQQAYAKRQARATRCREILDQLHNGQISPDAVKWLGDGAGLVKRIRDGALVVTDLKYDKGSLPCAQSFLNVFASAAAKSGKAWGELDAAEGVSHDLRQLLGARKPALAAEAARAFQARVESKARYELRTGKRAADLQSALGLCELRDHLLDTTSTNCKRLAARAADLTRREVAAAEARETRETAAARQHQGSSPSASCEATECARNCYRFFGTCVAVNPRDDAVNPEDSPQVKECHAHYRACMRGCGCTGDKWNY